MIAHRAAAMPMASNQKAKRKRSVITLEKKLAVVDELKKEKSQRCVADLYSLPKSTVADIWKDRDKIQSFTAVSRTLPRCRSSFFQG